MVRGSRIEHSGLTLGLASDGRSSVEMTGVERKGRWLFLNMLRHKEIGRLGV